MISNPTVGRLADAVGARDVAQVRAMLNARPELVNMAMAENDERRALHFAVLDRAAQLVRLLMARGADARTGIYPHRDATTALAIATERGYDEIVAIIREEEQRRTAAPTEAAATSSSTAAQTQNEAAAAILRGDADWLRARHAAGALINTIGDSGGLLTLAVTHDRPDMLALLLELGFDPNERTHLEDVEQIVYSAGFPLWRCAAQGKLAMAEMLLKHGANPNVHVYASGSPVYSAYRHRQPGMVDLLRRYGGVVGADIAGLYRETDLARQMLADEARDGGALPEGLVSPGRTVAEDLLDYGSCGGDPDIIRMALERIDWPRGDARWFWMLGRSLESDAHGGSHLECFRQVLDRSGPHMIGRFGRTMLHEVAAQRSPVTPEEAAAFARLLLDAGAAMDRRDDLLKSTPLGWACRWGRVEIVQLLLDRDADSIEPDAEPWATPRAWAEKMGHATIRDMLRPALVSDRDAGRRALARYETMAEALLDAYRTGVPEAMERHYRYTWHRRPWRAMRSYVQLDLGKRPSAPDEDVEITLDEARYLIAIEHGFANWETLHAFTDSATAGPAVAAKPVRLVNPEAPEASRTIASSREWDEILRLLAMHPSARLDAEGQMTDAVLAEVARVDTITALDLGGSKNLTDEGVRHLARLTGLKHLDLSGTAITDRGLQVLRELPALETFSLAMTRVTDEGVSHLAHCHELREVNLAWTRTGDGALRALAGKRQLCEFISGNDVTDAGIPLLHELPVFKSWQGGEMKMALLSYRSRPNHLSLRGSFSDRGMKHMRGLDGLFGLNLDDSHLAITAAALEPLVSLPHLGWLAVDAKDDWMSHIAAMPQLRFLGAQDTMAGDDGFVALSKSPSIEYIWGRRCHNLRRTGFLALANMPALRGLSVSCLNVDDIGVSALPSFPALKELMPMDVPDTGYRHIGKCEHLESLILMYCRDTTDAATEHLTGLRQLSYYFNSYTRITDRTPELLSEMNSLERITFDACHGLTNAGVARLARLPRLRELHVSGKGVTADVVEAFSPRVSVLCAP